MGKYVYVLALVLASWVLFGNNAMSKTPDGATPAVESVCNGEVGAAYGLCVSYCEATDCADGVQQANPEACKGLKEMLLERVGKKDFPCECPCDYNLVPATALCLGEVYNETIKVSVMNKTADSDTEVISIDAKGRDALGEVTMYADVMDSTDPMNRSCSITIKKAEPHDCTQAAQDIGTVEGLSQRVVNDCKRTFEQYAQDAIFKASQRKLIEIELLQEKSIGTIGE